jgi:hypothetical protein
VGALFVCVSLSIVYGSSVSTIRSPPALLPSGARGHECENPRFASHTLKLAHEMPVVALLGKSDAMNVFEASEIIKVDDYYYVVSDDVPVLGRIDMDLSFFDKDNMYIYERRTSETPAPLNGDEGGYEALFHDRAQNVFYGVVEATKLVAETSQNFHAIVDELKIDGQHYVKYASCPTDFEFTSGNKGIEGAIRVQKNNTNEFYFLGLCEGNFCSGGAKGRTPGNGRLIVFQKELNVMLHGTTFKCVWQMQKMINLPSSITFIDYSSIAISGNRLAIISQESSQLWVGHLDLNTLEVLDDGKIYDFPRNDACEIVYCNLEGIDWINENMLIATSDQMKGGGDQNFRCLARDQSVHVFVLP